MRIVCHWTRIFWLYVKAHGSKSKHICQRFLVYSLKLNRYPTKLDLHIIHGSNISLLSVWIDQRTLNLKENAKINRIVTKCLFHHHFTNKFFLGTLLLYVQVTWENNFRTENFLHIKLMKLTVGVLTNPSQKLKHLYRQLKLILDWCKYMNKHW